MTYTNNKFYEFSTVEEMATRLSITVESAQALLDSALKYCKDKRVSHYAEGLVSGFLMTTLVIKGKKTKNTLKQGFQLVYAYNNDAPDLSELGDAYITKKVNSYYRVG